MVPRIGAVEYNLAVVESLGLEALERGAKVVVLPEFFTTGMAFSPALASAALPPDGPAVRLLLRLAREGDAVIGGSFLCRESDGNVRNKFVLAGPDGVLGSHDKDLPTMWENAFYVGGDDDGVITDGDRRALQWRCAGN